MNNTLETDKTRLSNGLWLQYPKGYVVDDREEKNIVHLCSEIEKSLKKKLWQVNLVPDKLGGSEPYCISFVFDKKKNDKW